MHGQDAAGDQFTVLSDAEVPRLYPHHLIKHELQVQTAFHTHLHSCEGVYNGNGKNSTRKGKGLKAPPPFSPV